MRTSAIQAPIVLLALTLCAALDHAAMASPRPTQEGWIDELVLPAIGKDAPGCAVGVFVQERIAFSKGYGIANLATREEVTPRTVFDAASLSKQFTALAIEQLRQRGLLTFEDQVRSHLPGFQPSATIGQLLHHTSGLPEVLTLAAAEGVSREQLTMSSAIELLMKLDAASASSDAPFKYSNSGYVLLARVVEQLSGLAFGQYLQREVFEPFGMRGTRLAGDQDALDPPRAVGYYRDPSSAGSFKMYPPLPVIYGSGGVLTTLDDLFYWHRALYTELPATGRRLIDLLSDGKANGQESSIPYGLGLRVGSYRGFPLVHHGGGNRGVHHHFATFPQQGLSVVVLCNAGDLKPWEWTLEIADLFLPQTVVTPTPAP